MAHQSSLRPLLRLLGSAARLKLLIALTDDPRSVAELSEATGISNDSVRYHLQKLVAADVLEIASDSVPRRYRPSGRVQIVRYRGKVVCSVEATTPEKIIFSIPNEKPVHKMGKHR